MSTAGPSRSSISAKNKVPLKPVERDIWGLGLSSDLPPPSETAGPSLFRRRPPNSTTSSPGKPTPTQRHPLYRKESPPQRTEDSHVEVLGDVSRPNLTRLTSDLERRAGSSRGNGSEEGSRKGSMDRLRMTGGEATEVEVLIHQVQPNESLAGIALLYGIDLATLRKTNKLWPSDPVHLRRHLYIPLDACRWNKASETLIRGPGEGQVTLESKKVDKGEGREQQERNLIDLAEDGSGERSHRRAVSLATASHRESPLPRSTSEAAIPIDEVDPWSSFSPTNSTFYTPSTPLDAPLVDIPESVPTLRSRTVDIVRIPSSQLRFFPKPPRPPDSSRTSIDSGPRDSQQPPPPLSIQNDLHFSHDTVPRTKSSGASVRLRPPTTTPSTGTGLADKFSNLFFIPPPPPGGLALAPSKRASPRMSLDSSRASPRGSTTGSPRLVPVRPAEEVEMLLRARRGSEDTVKLNGQRRKLD